MAWARDSRDPAGRGRDLTATRDALAAVFREEAGRLAASVTRILGDFDAAEEVVQDALLAAWQQWPADGVPDRPGAWLWTVARRRAIDVLRRDARYRERARVLGSVSFPVQQADEDDRLMLIFTCCHPALSCEAQHVDGPAAGHRPEPGTGTVGHALGRPLLPGRQQRILDDFFGRVEVAQDAHDRRGEPTGLLPEYRGQRVPGGGQRVVMTGRISTVPRPGHVFAIRSASSRSATSISA